jgi:formate hydrogenlyase subunit 3/multisubunit Na+/H+ antiporter MnhD subunit
MDGLSALFLGIISLLAVSVSVYSLGYTKDLSRGMPSAHFFLYGFLLSMVGVVIAGHAVVFSAWEVMFSRRISIRMT